MVLTYSETSDFFAALDPRLRYVVEEKLSSDIYPLGDKAGELTPGMAKLTGLNPGIAVSIGNVDAHVAVLVNAHLFRIIDAEANPIQVVARVRSAYRAIQLVVPRSSIQRQTPSTLNVKASAWSSL